MKTPQIPTPTNPPLCQFGTCDGTATTTRRIFGGDGLSGEPHVFSELIRVCDDCAHEADEYAGSFRKARTRE
jgi:hypothetical protein